MDLAPVADLVAAVALVAAVDLAAVADLVAAVARLPILKLSRRCGQEPLRAPPTQAW